MAATAVQDYLSILQSEGYILLEGLLSAADCQAARDIITNPVHLEFRYRDNHELNRTEDTVAQTRTSELISQGPQFVRMLTNPVITELLTSYLGESFRCATFSSNVLRSQRHIPESARERGLDWHVDYPYGDVDERPIHLSEQDARERPLGAQVIFALDDFRLDNGGTEFFPLSHLLPSPRGPEAGEQSQTLSCPAGSVLIAHSAWVHRQTINVSVKSRAGLLANFVRGYVVPKDDMSRQFRHFQAASVSWPLSQRERDLVRRLCLGKHERGLTPDTN